MRDAREVSEIRLDSSSFNKNYKVLKRPPTGSQRRRSPTSTGLFQGSEGDEGRVQTLGIVTE